jgi:hypothetical protein
MKMAKRTKQQDRRYYLHKKIKEYAEIDTVNKTIEVPQTRFSDIPKPLRYYVGQLILAGYNVQLKLFPHNN